VILIHDKLLLVRQSKGGASYHLLPGGGVQHGETLEHALQREVGEETGLECEVQAPLLINDTIAPSGDRHLVNITFGVRVTGGRLLETPTDPAIELLELVNLEQLNELDLRPPIGEALIGVLTSGPNPTARYLGAVWTEE